jgi:hypothetical protein
MSPAHSQYVAETGHSALIPRCTECEAAWLPADDERWRAYHAGDDLDEPAELFFFCPACAEREFGDD